MNEKGVKTEHWFEFPVPLSSNMRTVRGRTGHMHVRSEAKQYQANIRAEMIAQKIRPITGDVEVTVKWYRKRKAGDVMESFKDLWDALEAEKNYGYGPYLNDKQIAQYLVRRNDLEPHNPRIVVRIRPLVDHS